MTDTLKPVAKAIAGFLAPIVLALLAALLEWIGLDIPVDPSLVETLTVSVVSAVLVYLTRNTPKPTS